MGLVPLLYAIFASSPISDGSLNGYHSFRGHIWLDTDPDRCGMPAFVFSPEASFEHYVEYALDVPMYFLIRGHSYIDLTRPPGITFRQYMEKGFGKERASVEDWANHLTTIFTEVRLKTYIEVRSADSQPPSLMLALPALMKGVLYDEDCATAAWDLVKRWSYEDRLRMNDAAHKIGLEARAGKITFHQLANELIEIARVGLTRQRALNERGEDESIYLMRLADLVRSGHNQASLIIENWKGRWNYEMRRLVEGCSYTAEGWL
jgi:glutamate--cysteine ligase